jgi:hypothetical protein
LVSNPTESFEPPVAHLASPADRVLTVERLLLALGPTWFQQRDFSAEKQFCVPLRTRKIPATLTQPRIWSVDDPQVASCNLICAVATWLLESSIAQPAPHTAAPTRTRLENLNKDFNMLFDLSLTD